MSGLNGRRPGRKTILMTGAAGRIGTALRAALADEFLIRCLDKAPVTGDPDAVLGDVTDLALMERTAHGVDAVVHLAANPSVDQPWSEAAAAIAGTHTVLEAARRAGIRKVVLASSAYMNGWREVNARDPVGPASPVSPTTLYGVSKMTSELLGQYFATTFDLSVVCLRIGAFHVVPPRPDSPDHYIVSTWCSPRDLVQLVRRSIHADGIRFAVFYGVSNNTRNLWDITNARELVGYAPEDNAEDLLDPIRYDQVAGQARLDGRGV